MGNDEGEDHSHLDVFRNGVLSAAVAGASIFGTPQGATIPTFATPTQNDAVTSQQFDAVEICDPAMPTDATGDLLDASHGEADHLLDAVGAWTEDREQRAEAMETIEASADLMPESADHGDPAPDFWEQSWPEGSAEAAAVEFHDGAEPMMDSPVDVGGPMGPF